MLSIYDFHIKIKTAITHQEGKYFENQQVKRINKYISRLMQKQKQISVSCLKTL